MVNGGARSGVLMHCTDQKSIANISIHLVSSLNSQHYKLMYIKHGIGDKTWTEKLVSTINIGRESMDIQGTWRWWLPKDRSSQLEGVNCPITNVPLSMSVGILGSCWAGGN